MKFYLVGIFLLLLLLPACERRSGTDRTNREKLLVQPTANNSNKGKFAEETNSLLNDQILSNTAEPVSKTTEDSFFIPKEDLLDDEAADNYQNNKLLYSTMSEEQKIRFLTRRARHISRLISNETYEFNEDIIKIIKNQYIDPYQARINNRSQARWGADLNLVFKRAQRYSPCIIRAFRRHGVRVAIGLYLVAVETEYQNIASENGASAAGLFQFIPGTARYYGVSPSERTNVEKMADAAARYMSDRISDFGNEPMSVTLAIAGYNRNPESVLRDMHDVLSSSGKNKERSFWNLISHSDILDKKFQGENVKYVPKFFAAAIIGETPWAFGLDMKQSLSSCEFCSQPCSN